MQIAGKACDNTRSVLGFILRILFSVLVLPIAVAIAGTDEFETHLLDLNTYKPIYLITGAPDAKIEFSFRVALWKTVPLNFGYTQLMFWDLIGAGGVFTDINYAPEVFYRLPVGDEKSRWLDLGIFEHESNGQAGANGRGWNRVYVRYHLESHVGDRARLLGNFKVAVPFLIDPNNSNLPQYRGVWEVDLTLSEFLGRFFYPSDLIFRLYPGGAWYANPFLGGQELTFRTKTLWWGSFTLPVVFQMFHGYAENLLDYKNERWGFRAGFGI